MSYLGWVQSYVGWYFATGRAEAPGLRAELAFQVLRDVRAALSRDPSWSPGDDDAFLGREIGLVRGLQEIGDFDTAFRVQGEFVIPATGPGHRKWSNACSEFSVLHRRAFRWSEAQDWNGRAAVAATTPEDRLMVAVNEASLALEKGLPDLGIPAVDRARRLAMEIGSPLAAYQALFVALRLQHALHRPDRAVAMWREFESGPLRDGLLAGEDGAGRTAQLAIRVAMTVLQEPEAQGLPVEEAVDWLRAALAPGAASLDEQRLARNVLLAYLLDRGDPDAAGRLLQEARADLAVLDTEAALLDERGLHLGGLSVRHARLAGLPREELGARLRLLERQFQQMLDRWSEQPAARAGLGPLFFADRQQALAELVGATLTLGDGTAVVEAALAFVVRAQAQGSLARALGAGEASVAEIRGALTTVDRGLLVYVPGAAAGHVFALDAGAVHCFPLAAGSPVLDRERRGLLAELQTARADPGVDHPGLQASRARLSRLLLPEAVAAALGRWRHVTIVGIESLGYLPFEFLLLDGRPLGVAMSCSYLPSLTVGFWLQRQRPAPPPRPADGGKVLLVACPDVGTDRSGDRRPPLPFGEVERAQLADGARSAEVSWLRGKAATWDTLRAADPASFDLLQILAHGVRDEGRDDPQGIALSGGDLWGPQFEGQALPPCVVLTVCRAGNGRLRRGDDGRHLWSGAALVGGARSVVLPWLEVDYRAALALSAGLHRALFTDGLGPAEALRLCRAEMFREEPGALDPFLFHLVGLGEMPLALPGGRSPGPAILLGLAGALGLGLLLVMSLRWRRTRRV